MTESTKKLEELRVVDLKNELERRGLDKNGVKATLLERLKQVLEKEGQDPETFKFAVSTDFAMSPAKKPSSRRKSGKPNEADAEEDETPATFESFNELVVTEGGDHHEDSGEENNETEEANDQSEPVVEDEEVATANDSGAEMEGADEESDEQVEDNKIDDDEGTEHNGIDQEEEERPEPNDEQSAEAETEEAESRAIPNPEQVEPQCMFTSEDTINLHRAAEETSRAAVVSGANNAGAKNDHIDDASSMMVNVDETTSELSDVASQVDQANKRRIIIDDNKKEQTEEPVTKKVASNEASEEPKSAPPTESAVKTDAEQAGAKQQDAVSKTKTETSGKKIDATNKSPECSMWIIGLPSTIKAAELKSLFSKYGRVATAKVMSSKSKSDGPQWFGFITMGSPEEASKCITNLHRTELHGKMISVEKASDSKGNPVQLRKLANTPTTATTPTVTTTEKAVKTSSVDTKKDAGVASKKTVSAKPSNAVAAGAKTTATKTAATAKKPAPTKAVAKSTANAAKADDKKEKTASDGEKATSDKPKEAAESKEKSEKDKESDKDKEKDKEDHKTRSVSRTRSTKSAHERHSSKERKSVSRSKIRAIRYRESRENAAPRRGFVPSRGPSRGYRGSTRGFSASRGYRGGAPSTYGSRYTGGAFNYASPIASAGVGYRPVTAMPVIDSRNNREHAMIERMRQREEEHRRREEQLRLEREKERLRFEREKLDRERLELQHQRQHMRMAMAYERSAVMNATQSMMGVKRAYEGLDPYAAAAQEAKRPNYGATPVSGSGGQRSSRRTPPRSSYADRDNYRGGRGSSGRGSGMSARSAGGRYGDSRSSRDTSGGGGRASSSSRRSRYDMQSSRRQGGDVDSPRQSAPSWDRPSRSAAVESALALTDVGGWSTAAPGAVTSVSSQWRTMPGASSALYSGGPSTGSLLYASLGGSGGASGASAAYLGGSSSSAADRFDAYKYSSSRRY